MNLRFWTTSSEYAISFAQADQSRAKMHDDGLFGIKWLKIDSYFFK